MVRLDLRWLVLPALVWGRAGAATRARRRRSRRDSCQCKKYPDMDIYTNKEYATFQGNDQDICCQRCTSDPSCACWVTSKFQCRLHNTCADKVAAYEKNTFTLGERCADATTTTTTKTTTTVTTTTTTTTETPTTTTTTTTTTTAPTTEKPTTEKPTTEKPTTEKPTTTEATTAPATPTVTPDPDVPSTSADPGSTTSPHAGASTTTTTKPKRTAAWWSSSTAGAAAAVVLVTGLVGGCLCCRKTRRRESRAGLPLLSSADPEVGQDRAPYTSGRIAERLSNLPSSSTVTGRESVSGTGLIAERRSNLLLSSTGRESVSGTGLIAERRANLPSSSAVRESMSGTGLIAERRANLPLPPLLTRGGSASVVASSRRSGETPQANTEAELSDLSDLSATHRSRTSTKSKLGSPFRINDDSQDLSDVKYRPMLRLKATAPEQDITQCLRDAMSMPAFSGRTSRFIDDLITEGWKMTQDRTGRGVLQQHPGLTENGLFAVTVFTLQIQAFDDDATDEDEFYFQFGNTLRYRRTDDMAKLKPYVYHFVKGLEALPKYEGTLWRGVHGNFAEIAGNNFDLHSIIYFNAYSSASPNREVAKQFLGSEGLLFKYMGVANTACDVRSVSAYPNEEERMIIAGSQFIVLKEAHRSDDGIMEIHLKEAKTKHA